MRRENPCDRCGFQVYATDRYGEVKAEHPTMRDCFQAAYQAAVDDVKTKVTAALEQVSTDFGAGGTPEGDRLSDAFNALKKVLGDG